MSKFLADLKDFVHSLTTSDHYASYDPTRPAGASRDQEEPLTGDYPSYPRAAGQRGAGYQQGSRSEQLNSGGANNDIQMTEYDMSTVPSPRAVWERIDNWVEQNYPELFDQLQYPATNNDLDELEHDLDCHLPPDVRESYLVHDGQERGGRPTGLFFGVTLLDMESLSEEWAVWRNTAVRLNMRSASRPKASSAAQARGSRGEWAERQLSIPIDAVQSVYAHPGWVPLAKDFGGNNIAVDLAPGPKGHVGQVILFGRDFDTKYVVAESWGHFLEQFATDLESGNCFIDEDIEEAVFAYRLPTGRLTSYFSVLRSRIERQFRRTRPAAAAAASPATPQDRSGSVTPSLVSPAASQVNLPTSAEETVIKLTPASPSAQKTAVLPEAVSEAESQESEVELDATPEATPEAKPAEAAEAAEPKVEAEAKAEVESEAEAEPVRESTTDAETEVPSAGEEAPAAKPKKGKGKGKGKKN